MKPDSETLRRLYIDEKLPTRVIADMYDVAHISVGRWLKSYGISARPTGKGLNHRGVTPPTKEELIDLIHAQHLSYDAIGDMFGVTRSAVYRWTKQHNMEGASIWVTRRKGVIPELPDKEELEDLYSSGLSTSDIGSLYGVSSTSIKNLLHEFEIPVRLSGWSNGATYICRDGMRVRSSYEMRVGNWLIEQNLLFVYEPPLPFSSKYHADFFVNGWYIEIWGVTNSPTYNRRKKFKLSKYTEYGIPLINIYAHSFDAAHDNWERKLAICLTTPMPLLDWQ